MISLADLDGWNIVVPETSTAAERYAADEFRRLHVEAGGVALPVVTGCDGGKPSILIGQSAAELARENVFHPDEYGEEELHIVISPREIAITGGRPRGTLYGVYTFWEDYGGVRFLTAEHTHIPRMDRPLRLPDVNRRYSPPLAFRLADYGELENRPDFAVRLRQNTGKIPDALGGRCSGTLINHTVQNLLPWEKHGKEHPEYFCMRQGTRPPATTSKPWHTIQPCFSNPDARRIMLAGLLEAIAAGYPARKEFSVSQADNEEYCECPACAALDAKVGSHCGQLLDCIEWMAGELAKTHPDVVIGTLIYRWSRTPPSRNEPLPANIKIQLCSIECCQIHPIDDTTCPLSVSFMEDLDRWSRLCANIGIWHYNVNFINYLLPCPNLHNIERNVRFFIERHAKGIFMQCARGTEGSEFSDLRAYVICNLLWDPSRSGEALMEEFLRLHYGESAPPIRRFIERVHESARASGLHKDCYAHAADYGLTPELGRQGLRDFEEALALAPDQTVRRRVEKASVAAYRLALEPVALIVKQVRDATEPVALILKQGGSMTEARREEFRPLVERFLELWQKHAIVFYGENVRTAKREPLWRALLAPPP